LVVRTLAAGDPLPRIYGYLRLLPTDLWLALCGAIGAWLISFRYPERRQAIGFIALPVLSAFAFILAFAPATQARYFFPLFPFLLILSVFFVQSAIDVFLPEVSSKAKMAAWFAIILAFSLQFVVLWPHAEYLLEGDAPQPDYKSAYSIIRNEEKAGDIVISGFSQFHKVYLGEKGMWLKMNFNGDPRGLEKRISNGLDFYVGAPIISSAADLQGVMRAHHGFIVIDSMTDRRLSELFPLLEADPKVERIFSDPGEKNDSEIYLYRF
jgi:hypothetical protein